ncbi:hypothetical protein ACLQ8Z_03415 [Bordetella hinzii]|uniref:hypothetical protein n=1 Tax=Bordetella hinzii TaxID=103855 RepID=UPI0039FC9CD9
MNEQNNAAQEVKPQPVLSFDERERILCQFVGEPINHDREMARAIEQAVLSKLRAPVADERQPDGKRPDLDWIEGVRVTDTVGRGWCVRIDGTDIFEDVNRYGCKGRKSFQIASDLPSKHEAERAAVEWLDRQRAALASAPVADGEWPTLSDLHLQALMFAYNEGYSKAIDGRKFKNPFETSGSQAAAWELGTQDGTEARSKMESTPVAGYIKPDPAAPTHPRYVSELKYRSAADAEADPEGKGWLKVYAAPQASAEDVRELPDAEMRTLIGNYFADDWAKEAAAGLLHDYACALKTQADKDGGQQRACTCHPDDRPAGDCQKQYAATECQQRARDVERLRRIAWLIGCIFVHGNFKAETFNERELEKLLRENGTFWDSLEQFDAALSAAQAEQGERDAN